MTDRPALSPLREHWWLDDDAVFLNHGSFGACPRLVLDRQSELRREMERQPVRFFTRDLEPQLVAARLALAEFVGAAPDRLVFVPNATTGANAVLQSLPLAAGDELLTTTQAYNACANALRFVAERAGARVVTVELPFPLASRDEVVERVLAGVTERTKLALIDHISSPTGLILPVAALVASLQERGVRVLVDGAHAPGQVPLDIEELGADYYTGNCHKWLFAPKGAAFLHVAEAHLNEVRPVVISHGANTPRPHLSRFQNEFGWTGTGDFTPWLCVPDGIRFGGSLVDGGWAGLRARNRALALDARGILCEARGVAPPCPEEMVGALAAVPLPDGPQSDGPSAPPDDPLTPSALQTTLLERWGIEVPIVPWPRSPHRLVRVSAQAYNTRDEYVLLAAALEELLPAA